MIKYINPSYEVITPLTPEVCYRIAKKIERIARACYPQRTKEHVEVDHKLLRWIMRSDNLTLIEHATPREYIQVRFVVSAVAAGEMANAVRGNASSIAQTSIKNQLHGRRLDVIRGGGWDSEHAEIYEQAYRAAIDAYQRLINKNVLPIYAMGVLPLSLATTIDIIANIRSWYGIIRKCTDQSAHPDVAGLMGKLREEMARSIPIIYDNCKQGK